MIIFGCRKRVLEGAEVGWYVRLHVKGVGTHLYQAAKGKLSYFARV